MLRSWKVFASAIVIAVISIPTLAFADIWQPYEFEPKNQMYEYKITNFQDGSEKISAYVLEMDKMESGQMEISVKTTWIAGEDELDQQILGGWWAAGAFGLTMAFINPMYAAFFGGLDMHVGNKMSFFGAGVVEVTGTEKVAGRTGFVCLLRNQDAGSVLGRYVVDPTVPLPLKTEVFEEDGTEQYKTELQHIEF